jgi:hypothetical protein
VLPPHGGTTHGDPLLTSLLAALEAFVASGPPSAVLGAALSFLVHVVCSGRPLPDLLRCIRLVTSTASTAGDMGLPDVHALLR